MFVVRKVATLVGPAGKGCGMWGVCGPRAHRSCTELLILFSVYSSIHPPLDRSSSTSLLVKKDIRQSSGLLWPSPALVVCCAAEGHAPHR